MQKQLQWYKSDASSSVLVTVVPNLHTERERKRERECVPINSCGQSLIISHSFKLNQISIFLRKKVDNLVATKGGKGVVSAQMRCKWGNPNPNCQFTTNRSRIMMGFFRLFDVRCVSREQLGCVVSNACLFCFSVFLFSSLRFFQSSIYTIDNLGLMQKLQSSTVVTLL